MPCPTLLSRARCSLCPGAVWGLGGPVRPGFRPPTPAPLGGCSCGRLHRLPTVVRNLDEPVPGRANELKGLVGSIALRLDTLPDDLVRPKCVGRVEHGPADDTSGGHDERGLPDRQAHECSEHARVPERTDQVAIPTYLVHSGRGGNLRPQLAGLLRVEVTDVRPGDVPLLQRR